MFFLKKNKAKTNKTITHKIGAIKISNIFEIIKNTILNLVTIFIEIGIENF